MEDRNERTAQYRYEGPADQFAPYAGAEFVSRGDVLVLTDRQAAIARAYGNQITLLRHEPEVEDEPVADQEEAAEEPVADDENDDAAEAPSRTRRRR